jgi:hypothetical protein
MLEPSHSLSILHNNEEEALVGYLPLLIQGARSYHLLDLGF